MDHLYYCKKKTKRRCCVPGCNDEASKRHRFPKNNESLFQQWAINVCNPRMKNLSVEQIYKSYSVCERHFSPECIVPGTLRGLSATAVPTLFLPKRSNAAKQACVEENDGVQESIEKMTINQGQMYKENTNVQNENQEAENVINQTLEYTVHTNKEKPQKIAVGEVSVTPPRGNISISATFSHICKLCLRKGTLKNLQNIECAFTAAVIGVIEVFLESKIPDSICITCLEELKHIALFIKQCKHSQFILNQIKTECDKLESKKDTKIQIIDSEDECDSTADVQFKVINTENLDLTDLKIPTTLMTEDAKVDDSNRQVEVNFSHFLDLENITPGSPEQVSQESKIKKCKHCGEEVTRMVDHYKTHKGCRPKSNCPHCNKTVSNKMLKSHILGVHSQSSFLCHICSKMFKYKVNLCRHLKNHKMPKRFMCEFCGKAYSTKIQLNDHLNKHTGLKPHACAYCDEKFSLRSVRKTHEDRHVRPIVSSTDSPVTCDVCNITFAHERALKLHSVVHDESRIYQCNICKVGLESKKQLDEHLAEEHNIDKRFLCVCCNKRFRMQGSLIAHMRIHTGERPYLCTECPKTFTQSTHLKYHMLCHRGIKSYVCKFCSKSFTLKGNLTVHMRLHTGERPYVCHVCKAGFRDASMRKRHVMKKHGVEQVQLIGADTLKVEFGEDCK